MKRPSKSQYGLGIVAIFCVAVVLRMGPLLWSPLPFNPDGIVYAGLVRSTVSKGALPIDGLPVDSFLFTVFLADLEYVTGVPARYIAQPAIAVVGALPCLVAAVFATRFGGHLGWSRSNRRAVGLLAAALLAVDGVYLHRSMAVDEQTIGLLFVPLVALALVHIERTGQRRWYLLLGIVLVSLPPLHNLDSLLVVFMLAIAMFLRRLTRKNLLTGGALAIGNLVVFVGYSWGVAAVTPATIIQSERISYAPGLLLAWLIVVTIVSVRFSKLRARSQRFLMGGAFTSILVLVAINQVRPIFPGSQTTPNALLWLVVPLFALPLLGAWAIPLLDERAPEMIALLSVIGAGFVIIGMSFTATLTLEYLNTAYRAQTFLHFPMSVLGAIGGWTLLKRVSPSIESASLRRAAITGGIALLVVSAAVSIPVAFGGLELLTYKGTTTEAEFAAAEFGIRNLGDHWAADDHISRVSRYFDPQSDPINTSISHVAPVYTWVHANGPPPDCPTIVQSSWTTVGAQFFPRAPATISTERLDRWEQNQSVIYRSSGPDPIMIGTSTNTSAGC